jgi:hypothetical protein
MSNTTNDPLEELDELDDQTPHKGPNIILLYAFLALGILAAMAFAAAIVYPFYKRI